MYTSENLIDAYTPMTMLSSDIFDKNDREHHSYIFLLRRSKYQRSAPLAKSANPIFPIGDDISFEVSFSALASGMSEELFFIFDTSEDFFCFTFFGFFAFFGSAVTWIENLDVWIEVVAHL